MNTKLVGIKEFRKNVTGLVKQAVGGSQRLVIMNRNKPLFEVVPFRDGADINDLLSDLHEAQKDVEAGNVYTHDEVLAELS